MKLFVYSLGPIDFWAGWQPEEAYLDRLHQETQRGPVEMGYSIAPFDAGYQKFKAAAFRLAPQAGWEGDIRPGNGPFVSALPGGMDSDVMIAWKQDNNGITFIASPIRLAWLEYPSPSGRKNWATGEI